MSSEEIWKTQSIVPTALLFRVQHFRKCMYKTEEHSTNSPLDDDWVVLSTSKAFKTIMVYT